MICPLFPDESADLAWKFGGEAEAALGVRSWLGPMGDRLRAGTVGCSTSGEARDIGDVARRLSRIDERLARVPERSRRWLAVYHGGFQARGIDPDRKKGDAPPDHGHVEPPLRDAGPLGLVMAAMSGASSKTLRDLTSKAAKGQPGATSKITALRMKAEGAMAKAWADFAATRPRADDATAKKRRAEANRRKEADRRGHFAGRVDEGMRVVYATPSAARADRRRAG